MSKVADGQLAEATARFGPTGGVELVPIKDGLVVYQQEPQRVHRLNRSAAVIYLLCDGSRTTGEITDELRLAFGMEKRPDHAVVDGLRFLTEAGLVHTVPDDEDIADDSPEPRDLDPQDRRADHD